MSVVVFQIKKGELSSYRVPQTNIAVERPGKGLRYIGYYKGRPSIYTEDYEKEDLKPSKVPEFVFNPTRRKCELRFSESDENLFTYITSHPKYNIDFELYSEEIESQRKLGKAEQVEKALAYVKESGDTRVRALGLAVLGMNSYGNTPSVIKATLKDKAINTPKEIIDACEDPLYNMKFTAALALSTEIVKTNDTKTAIVWADSKGRIMNIATGENYIEKFAKFLATDIPENKSVLQEIGTRLNIKEETEEQKAKEQDEIAKLKAQLEAYKTDFEIEKGKNERLAKENEKLASGGEPTLAEIAILELREKYKTILQKNVPFKYQNDIEWMENKIKEHESTT